MDVIVVKHSDDKYISTPFYIRFGGLKILKTKEKIVDIYVNNEKSELTMKLNSHGDGYFLIDKNEIQERRSSMKDIINNQSK